MPDFFEAGQSYTDLGPPGRKNCLEAAGFFQSKTGHTLKQVNDNRRDILESGHSSSSKISIKVTVKCPKIVPVRGILDGSVTFGFEHFNSCE